MGDYMVDTKYSAAVKNLFEEYYKRNFSMGEYRAQRRKIINQMDEEFNGASSIKNRNIDSDHTDVDYKNETN